MSNVSRRVTEYACSRVNAGPTTLDTVRKSYEFALNHVGQDKDSGEIWRDYIQFLRAGEVSSPLVLLIYVLIVYIDNDDLGGTAKNGRPPKGVPPGRTNPFG